MAEGEDQQAQTTPLLHGIQPPTGLDLASKHRKENWKIYKQRWNDYAIVAQLERQTEEYRVALFLYSIGPNAVKVYNSFDLPTDDKRKLPKIMEKFDKYAMGETNETYERFIFNSRDQKETETVDEYVAELRTLAQTCSFCTCLSDSLLRDRIVLGIKDAATRKRLLRQPELTLAKCIDICRSDEASAEQIKLFDKGAKEESAVHKVRGAKSKGKRGKIEETQRKPREFSGSKANRKQSEHKVCDYCGDKHKPGRNFCKAYGETCNFCKKPNHFEKQCKSKRRNRTHAVKAEESSDTDDSSEAEYLDSVTVKPETISTVRQDQQQEIYANMLIGDQPVKFHVDCGATVNVLPIKYVTDKKMIQPTERVLQMWNKSELKPVGTCRMVVRNPKSSRKYSIEFMIVEENLTPLLGAKVIQQMGLVEIHSKNFEQVATAAVKPHKSKSAEDLVKEYDDLFTGELGTLPGKQHLEVDPSVPPTVSAPSRRVPFAVKPKLKSELDRLTAIGVLSPVDEPTEWVSNLVIATKESGEIRLCIDPKRLNSALKRERYPLPVIEDVLPDLSKAKVFTKVDARNGYWHVQLDTPSSKLTTFDTPFGRYRWLRLPFGICVASEMFQKRLNEALDRLDGLLTVHDDMVIYGVGETEEEAVADHNMKLEKFFQRCRETGVKLNKKKLKLLCKEIPYLGHLVTEEGLKPDPEKVEAVQKMPRQENVKAVRRFCGFVNYLAKFLPHLADLLEPLQQLTHKDVPWQWNHEHDAAFNKLKQMITEAPVLKYYNPDEELTVQCDASEGGLGASLMQGGQPVAFASRSLTDPETRYAQIEKEMLAVVYALQKFDQYVYGHPVNVESDHKPLESIAKKPLRNAPKRLQGMLLKIQKYDVKITYKPGKEMYLADTLSRAFLRSSKNTQGEFERVNAVKSLPMSPDRLRQLRRATDNDVVLQHLKRAILQGWPEEKQSLPSILAPYFSYRDELSVYDGLVFKGERLIIPKEMRKEMLVEVHSSHIGINGCLRRARECIFWPGMTAEIKAHIATCETCQKYMTKQQQKETLMSHELTNRPWEKVGADIFTIADKDYLILVDYFSNFWEVNRLSDTKASTCN